MKKIYILTYENEFEDGIEDIRTLGIYSSHRNALQALERFGSITEYENCLRHDYTYNFDPLVDELQGLIISSDFLDGDPAWNKGFYSLTDED